MKLVSFTVTIPDKEIDLDLPAKLEGELPGILAWAVKGCLDWQQKGLSEPRTIRDATADYRHEQDILGDFIEDCCVLDKAATIPKSELKGAYHQWCQENSADPVTVRTFRARLIERDIREGRVGKARLWLGIRLRTDEDEVPDNKMSPPSLKNDKSDSNSLETFSRKEIQEKFTAKRVTNVTNVTIDTPSEYPTRLCPTCGGDYYLTDDKRWLCDRCHPESVGEAPA